MPIILSEVLIGLPYLRAAETGVAMQHDLLQVCGPVASAPSRAHSGNPPRQARLAKGVASQSASVIMSESRVMHQLLAHFLAMSIAPAGWQLTRFSIHSRDPSLHPTNRNTSNPMFLSRNHALSVTVTSTHSLLCFWWSFACPEDTAYLTPPSPPPRMIRIKPQTPHHFTHFIFFCNN